MNFFYTLKDIFFFQTTSRNKRNQRILKYTYNIVGTDIPLF